jgi:hypothetical protein
MRLRGSANRGEVRNISCRWVLMTWYNKALSDPFLTEVQMEKIDEIRALYRKYSCMMNGTASEFPIGTVPDDFGCDHLEVASDGKMSLIATDRGIETKRRETYSVDELLYWVFSGQANSKAFYRKNAPYNYAESQRLALDELGKISAEWRERLRKEQASFQR